MPNKNLENDDDNIPLQADAINQDEISDDEVSSIRESLDSNSPEPEAKKFVTGFRPNPPPKKSWWDKVEKKFRGGDTLVSKTENRAVCKVCCPGIEENTYSVKFSGCRDESIIKATGYEIAPAGTVYVPFMDEYTKWKYEQDLKKNKKS
jgi:hypothetical protein